MDAAHKSLKKTALFLAVALLAVVPGKAQQLQVSSTTVALNDNQARSIQVSASGSAAVTYSVSGKPSWLNIFSSNNFTTIPAAGNSDTLSFQLGNSSCGTCTAPITLSAPGSQPVTVTVSYTPGSTGGNGTLNASSTSLSFSAFSGQSGGTQPVTLSTTFNSVQINNIGSDSSWLSASITSGSFTVTPSTPATLTVAATAANLNNGTYTGHITVTPSTGTATVITVTFTVGTGTGGNGTITASSTLLSFSAQSGQTAQSQFVTLSTASGSVSILGVQSDSTWLTANITSGNFTITPTFPATLTVGATAASLLNGTYTGHITITPSQGTATVITVTFNVGTSSGGGQGTITVDHSSFSFNYPSNTLSAILTIGSSNQSVTTFNVTVASQNNWLIFQNVGSGTYNNVGLGSFNVGVNTVVASTLGTGTYTGSLSLSNPNNAADVTTVNLTLTVNGGTGGGTTGTFSLNTQSVNFVASPGGFSQSQNLVVTVSNNATVSLTATTINGPFYTISSPACSGTPNNNNPLTCTFSGSQTLTITINPGSFANLGQYTGSLSFSSGSTTAAAAVVMNLTNVSQLTVSQNALNFTASAGGPLQTQMLTVAVPNNAFVSVNLTSSNGNFFTVTSSNCNASPVNSPSCSFSGDQTLAVNINPANLSTGTYTGSIQIQSGGNTQTVNITLTVGSGTNPGGGTTSSIAAPSSLSFYFQAPTSQVGPPTGVITVGSVGTFSVTTSGNTPWLIATTSATSGPGYVVVTVNPQGLTAGTTYQGSVNINSASGNVSIPVNFTIASGVVVQPSTGTINVSFQSTTSQSISNTITLTASDNSSTPVSVSSSTSWITVNTSSTATPANFTVTITPTTLCNGLNTGTISVSAPNASNSSFTIPVVALVSGSSATGCSNPGGGTLNTNVSSLSFSSSAGSNPSAQTLSVSSATGTNVSFTYQVSGNVPVTATVNGTTISSGQSLTTPSSISVGVNTSGLAAGTYNGTITLTPSSGTATSIPVSLTISAASVTATPTSLTFTFAAGTATPPSQSVTVSGTAGSTFTATASSTGNWLSVSPTSGTVPGTLSVSVNPTGLSANTYTGTVTVAGSNGATGSTTINVTLTVTAPLPTITSLGSAASYVGGSISPGEIITIFGTSIGPTPGVSLTLDSTGKVSTTLGGVQVIINGTAAPMVYASNTQVSAVVPYELCAAGCGPGTIAQVSVKFLGQGSNGIPTPVSPTTTAIFTANASGSGQGAILNANSSANSAGNPANKGDVVAIYLTGEGQTSPSGVTGKVTTVASTSPITPVPLLPIGVTIGGQPASISFAGEAPGLVSGVMQLNVQIPTTAASGNLPVVVTIGSASSQAGVTVAVR